MVFSIITVLVTVGGFFTIMGGVALIPPELPPEERIDPVTSIAYPLDVQSTLYRQKVIASHGLRLIIIGSSIMAAGLLSMLGIWFYARRSDTVVPHVTEDSITAVYP
jgi:hypothetical protein